MDLGVSERLNDEARNQDPHSYALLYAPCPLLAILIASLNVSSASLRGMWACCQAGAGRHAGSVLSRLLRIIRSFWTTFGSEPSLLRQDRNQGIRTESRWNWVLHWANLKGELLWDRYAYNFSHTQMQWKAYFSVISWGYFSSLLTNCWNLPPLDSSSLPIDSLESEKGTLISDLAQLPCLLLSNFNALLEKPWFCFLFLCCLLSLTSWFFLERASHWTNSLLCQDAHIPILQGSCPQHCSAPLS